jgi:hypothetical protein
MSPSVCQTLSGAYFVAIAQSLFANRMLHALTSGSDHLDVALVLGTGASELQDVFSVILTALIPFKRLPDHEKKPSKDEMASNEVKASEEVQQEKKLTI